jgi:adenylate kinase
MATLVLLLGVSAVGKTCIGEAVASRSSITYVNASQAKLRLVAADERLDLFDQERSYEVNARFFDTLVPARETILVDSHATYPLGDDFVCLTPPSVCDGISGIVHVEADPVTVQLRRVTRGRPFEAIDLPAIERELVAERTEVARLVRRHDIPVCTLENTRSSVETATSVVIDFVTGLPERVS